VATGPVGVAKVSSRVAGRPVGVARCPGAWLEGPGAWLESRGRG